MISLIVALILLVALLCTVLLRMQRNHAGERALALAWRHLEHEEAALLCLRARYPADDVKALAAIDAALAMKRGLRLRTTRARHDLPALTATQVNLVALRRQGADYSVVSVAIGRLDLDALNATGRLADVSLLGATAPGFAAVVARDTLRSFLLPENHPWAGPTLRWYLRLPQEAEFVLVHLVPAGDPAIA